jgi:hypothetical protein
VSPQPVHFVSVVRCLLYLRSERGECAAFFGLVLRATPYVVLQNLECLRFITPLYAALPRSGVESRED